jgi:kynurenine formamidase
MIKSPNGYPICYFCEFNYFPVDTLMGEAICISCKKVSDKLIEASQREAMQAAWEEDMLRIRANEALMNEEWLRENERPYEAPWEAANAVWYEAIEQGS